MRLQWRHAALVLEGLSRYTRRASTACEHCPPPFPPAGLLGVAALAGAAVWYRGRRQRATFSWEQGAAAAGGSGGARSSFGRQGSSFKRFEDDAAAAAAAEQARAPAPVYGAAPSAGRQHVELSSQV